VYLGLKAEVCSGLLDAKETFSFRAQKTLEVFFGSEIKRPEGRGLDLISDIIN
jgi:hypothetical protein